MTTTRTARHACGLTALAMALALAGCGKVLDFRNADVSNGRIYDGSNNKPFSGQVTNVPYGSVHQGGLVEFTGIVGNVLGDIGEGLRGRPLCDVHVKDGQLHGKAVCSAGATKFAEFNFARGAADGESTIYSADGKVTGEADFSEGRLHGKSKVFDPKSGKVRHELAWIHGKAEGPVETLDAEGRVRFKVTFKNGLMEGEAIRYAADGKVELVMHFKEGQRQIDPPKATAAAEPAPHAATASPAPTASVASPACVDSWIAAHRKEVGPDAPINSEQIGEWEGWCKEGKRPG